MTHRRVGKTKNRGGTRALPNKTRKKPLGVTELMRIANHLARDGHPDRARSFVKLARHRATSTACSPKVRSTRFDDFLRKLDRDDAVWRAWRSLKRRWVQAERRPRALAAQLAKVADDLGRLAFGSEHARELARELEIHANALRDCGSAKGLAKRTRLKEFLGMIQMKKRRTVQRGQDRSKESDGSDSPSDRVCIWSLNVLRGDLLQNGLPKFYPDEN